MQSRIQVHLTMIQEHHQDQDPLPERMEAPQRKVEEVMGTGEGAPCEEIPRELRNQSSTSTVGPTFSIYRLLMKYKFQQITLYAL